MACNLSRGRVEACKESVGGIKEIYFVDYGALGSITATDDEVTDASGTFSAYKYELKSTGNTFEQTINSSRDNGTTFFDQTITINLKKLTKEDHKEVKLLAYGRPHIFVIDNNSNVFLVGKEHGADVTGGTIATGGALGDLNGYTLTFTAQEKLPANFVAGATDIDPFAGLSSATVTVVEGT